MNNKRKAAVLLFMAALSLSMFLAPAAPVVTAEPAAAPALSPEATEQLQQWYEDVSQPGFVAKVDGALAEWSNTGVLSEKVVTKSDGSVGALIIMAPWADEAAVANLVEVQWKVDLKFFKVWKVYIPSTDVLDAVAKVDGVGSIEADVYKIQLADDLARNIDVAPRTGTPGVGVDMYKIREVVGATTAPASNYDGSGVLVGHIDTGADFGNPELQAAYSAAFDPSGYGVVPTYYHANSTPVNVTEWLADPYNLLTYEGADGNIYLDVSGWDPLLNYGYSGSASPRYLIGDGDENTPYHERVGFVWLYAYYWGIEGAGNLINNYLWKDWCLPDPSNIYGNYSINWVMQQRFSPYAKIFAPAIVYNSTADKKFHLIINWEDTMGWNKFWTGGFYYASYDLTDILDAYDIISTFDWNFTDDFVEGEIFDVANPIVAHDYDGDGFDDFSLGALSSGLTPSWLVEDYNFNSYIDGSVLTDEAFCLYFDAGTHGTATASHVAAQGVLTYTNLDTGATFNMTGIAPGADIISARSITSGDDYGAYLWVLGFDLNTTSGEFYYTGNHQSDLVTNSWGWITPPSSEFNYLSLTWTILSTPGIIDPSYPGVLHVFSAGNEGSGFITTGPPGSAAGVLTVGASTTSHWLEYLYGPTQPYEGLASFTSKGPTYSGYVKPDVLAPGLAGYAAVPWYAQYCSAFWSAGPWWDPEAGYENEYTLFAGTSQAAPVAAGVAALLYQAATIDNPMKAKMILQQTAKDLGYDPATQGFGRIDAAAAIDFAVNNVGWVSYNTDSFANHANIMQDPWEYWGMFPAAYLGLYVNETTNAFPNDLWEGSLYFGNVWPGATVTIHQSIYGDFFTTLDDGTGWTQSAVHYRMAKSYQFTDTTFWYTDNVTGDMMYGFYNLRDELGPSVYDTEMAAYKYVTLGVAFNGAEVAGAEPWMFLYSWNDNNFTDGFPNLWNGSHGDELRRLTSASDASNTNMMSFATTAASLAAAIDGNMTLVVHDPIFDEDVNAAGHEFVCTVIFWEETTSSEISFAAGGTGNSINITLTVPSDAEPGIHQGYVVLTKNSYTLKLPYSYMVVANLTADLTEVNTIVDGFGAELEPYDSPVYGCMEEDPDDWDFRSFVVYNPHNVTYMGVRVVWDEAGSDMYVEVLDDIGNTIASGAGLTATSTAVIANLGVGTTTGYYYIFIHPVGLNGTTFMPVNYTLQVIMYDALTGGANDLILQYTANDITTPVPIADGDTIVGDHAVVNATYPKFNLPNMPEYEVSDISISFLSGIYEQRSGDLVIPDSSYNPFSGVIQLDQLAWEKIDGIVEGDTVKVTVDFTNGDCDIMAWWADTDNTTWSYSNNLLGDQMATGAKPEHGEFVADRSGSIMIGIFDYDLQPGEYYLTVDTLVGITEAATGATVTYDTYQFLKNGTFQVKVDASTYTNIDFSVYYASLSFANFFAPDVSNVQVSVSGNVVTITWDASDRNAGDDLYFEVAISKDGGVTYELLAVNLTETTYVWDSTPFVQGDQYKVRVTVYDNDPTVNPTAGQYDYWMGLSDVAYSDLFSAGGQAPPTTTTTTATTTTTPTPAPPITIDPLIIGLLGGIGVGVVVILILFLVKRR